MAESDPSMDFSELPDVVWVRVLQYLPLIDRANVSRTCHALHEAFHHPTLWNTQTLYFLGSEHNFDRRNDPMTLSHRYVELIKHFGAYFQRLTIRVSGHLTEISDTLKEVLEEVSERCRLESLTLDIGKATSRFHTMYGYPPDEKAVKLLVSFVRTAFRMRCLNISSWPMFERQLEQDDQNVFKSMLQNKKLVENLEQLTIFWLEGNGWTEREPILLDPDETIDIVNHFKNLLCLGLRSPMIKPELLNVLAASDRRKFETLKVLIHYIDPRRKPKYRIPNISPRSWQALVHRNPDFRVEVAVCLKTPDIELSNMLTPETPVSSFRFMRYASIDPMTMQKLSSLYSGTLTSFYSYCDSYDLDLLLIQLAQTCPNLRELLYHGNIYCNTITSLAQIKGEDWKVFEMNARNIKTRDELDDIDEDNVLHRGADGELQQVALRRFHTGNDEEQLNAMIVEVSKALDRPWKPVLIN